jgi:hypothetical protein
MRLSMATSNVAQLFIRTAPESHSSPFAQVATAATQAKNCIRKKTIFPPWRKNAVVSAFLWVSGRMFHRFLFTQGDLL